MITEKQRYLNWLDAQIKDHGLVSVHACTAADPLGPDVTMDQMRKLTDEAIFAELNAMNAAIARGAYRVFKDI